MWMELVCVCVGGGTQRWEIKGGLAGPTLTMLGIQEQTQGSPIFSGHDEKNICQGKMIEHLYLAWFKISQVASGSLPALTLFQARGRVSISLSILLILGGLPFRWSQNTLCCTQLATPGGGLETCSQDTLHWRMRCNCFSWQINPDSMRASLGEHLSLFEGEGRRNMTESHSKDLMACHLFLHDLEVGEGEWQWRASLGTA